MSFRGGGGGLDFSSGVKRTEKPLFYFILRKSLLFGRIRTQPLYRSMEPEMGRGRQIAESLELECHVRAAQAGMS
ncbi:hypothetical protein AML91_16965 [Paenibacillus jilunlii]|uniref:Uncharacterized protein n=1 Tax=Paenibacillus jilunlii TaxID=682956 RepID=A0ABR5STH5_9BACL|nr:hypothetical protein AML91_16965 [Paenibacillus jilunlii]